MTLPPKNETPQPNLVVVFTNADSPGETQALIEKMEKALGISAVEDRAATLPRGAFRYSFAEAGNGAGDEVLKVAKRNHYYDALKQGPQQVIVDMLPIL